jgi:hypothetical protein
MFHDDLRLTEQLRAALQENAELRAELEVPVRVDMLDREIAQLRDRVLALCGMNAGLKLRCQHLEAVVADLRRQLAPDWSDHYQIEELRSPSVLVSKQVDLSQLFSAAEFRKAVDDAVDGSHG